MKKIVSLIILTSFICLSFTSCFWNKGTSTRELEISEAVNSIYQELTKELPDPGDIDSINNYLISWAGKNHIPVSYDQYDNIIMSKQATHGYEKKESVTLQCSIGNTNVDFYQVLASTLFMISNLEEHGFIRAIFTADPDESFNGSSHISKNFLKTDVLISLIHDSKTTFIRESPYLQNYTFTKHFTQIAPFGTKAFEINIGPFSAESSGKLSGLPPNPIKELGDFFAYMKSKGVPIELANIEGGPSIYNFPSYAKAVFVVNENDVSKFEKYFNKDSAAFIKKYDKLYEKEPFLYGVSAVALPEAVISREDSANIISLLYTMVNGSFIKDEDDITIANTTVATISTTEDFLALNVCGRAKTHDTLKEITQTMEIIANLNESDLNKLNTFPAWHINKNSKIYEEYVNFFSETMDKKIDTKLTLQTTPIAIFKEKNPSMDALCMTVNIKNNLMEIEALEQLISKK